MDSIEASLVARPKLLRKFSRWLILLVGLSKGRKASFNNGVFIYLFLYKDSNRYPLGHSVFPEALGELRLRDEFATYYCRILGWKLIYHVTVSES